MTATKKPHALSNTQVMILKALSKYSDGLDRDELGGKIGVYPSSDVLGPVYAETVENHPDSLIALGYVEALKPEPGKPALYCLTTKGMGAAELYSMRRRDANGQKVPPKILDRAVLLVRNLKPYGLELFTDNDVKEIRALLPDDFHDVPIAGLRQQIVNRRKVGAYKEVKKLPAWYTEYRATEEFIAVAEKALKALGNTCTLNPDHAIPEENSVNHVYHRRFEDSSGVCVVGRELMKDLLVLCPRCYLRQAKFMVIVPDGDPR